MIAKNLLIMIRKVQACERQNRARIELNRDSMGIIVVFHRTAAEILSGKSLSSPGA
jgi:hypothetical protein